MPDDDFSRSHPPISGWTPPRRSPWPGRLLILTLLAGGVFTPPGQWLGRTVSRRIFPPVAGERSVVVKEKIVEKRVEVPAPPPPLPSSPSLSARGGDLNAMFSGIGLKTTLIPSLGETATQERASEASYLVELVLKVNVPKPASTMNQLLPLNPGLGKFFPQLESMVEKGKVSGFFHYLYELKEKAVAANLKRLDRLPTRHNFYDMDTMLELEHAPTKQKVLLMQADMDVVSDGSDGDRMPSFDDYILKSSHFQPSTSYGWAKLTNKQNPVIPKLEDELREAKEKLKSPKLSKEEKASLTSRVEEIPRITADLKRRSYLIGQEDPFIVIPSSLRAYEGRNAWTPGIGDYAVVIHGDLLMPAVVGDYGPTTKTGEASLRIARQIDPTAGPYKRPVSDLKVTYLIFPDSADAERKAPDYAAWRAKCEALVGRIGGFGTGVTLHEWEDRLGARTGAVSTPAPPAPQGPAAPSEEGTTEPAIPPAAGKAEEGL